MVRLLRFLRGYVSFTAHSGSVERFINLCVHHGVPTWDCRSSAGSFRGCTTPRGYRRMHRLARKANITIRVSERFGLPFVLHRYRKRIGIAAGAALFAALLIVSQQFIWVIEVQGCQTIDQQVLRNLLAEMGVRRGALKYNIDHEYLKQELLLRMDNVAWSALNLQGTTATLIVREREMPPRKIDTGVPANVVAAADGQIKRMEVTDGVAVRKKGDTVRKGELLVSGVYEDRWGLTHLLRANARVLAQTPQTLEVRVPLLREEYTMTGQPLRRDSLEVLGLRIPLYLYSGVPGEYKLETRSLQPELFGVQMPFSIRREQYIFYEHRTEPMSEQTALRVAERELARREERLGGTVTRREVTAATVDGELVLHGAYLVEMDIAAQVEIPVYDREELARAKKPREGGY